MIVMSMFHSQHAHKTHWISCTSTGLHARLYKERGYLRSVSGAGNTTLFVLGPSTLPPRILGCPLAHLYEIA